MDVPRCPRMNPMALEGTCTAAVSGSLGAATRPEICHIFGATSGRGGGRTREGFMNQDKYEDETSTKLKSNKDLRLEV